MQGLAELLEQYDPEELQRAAAARACTLSFHRFFREAWPIIEPDRELVDNWHIGILCEHAEALARGQIRFLVVNMPPGFLKSIVFAVMLPAWVWTWRPGWRSIWTSYNGELCTRDSTKCRDVIESIWYRERFSGPAGWGLTADQNEKKLFKNTRAGFRQCFGIAAGGTGHRGNLFGIDDPMSADDWHNVNLMREINAWYDAVVPTRLCDQSRDSIMCVMQRLSRLDLSQHLLDLGFQHLNLPQEFDRKRAFVTFSETWHDDGEVDRVVLSEDPRTEDGEMICPKLYPRYVLEKAKAASGSIVRAQQNQDPAAAEGELFKKASFRFFRVVGTDPTQVGKRPPECFDGPAIELDLDDVEAWQIVVDCKHKDIDTGSYVSMGLWGRRGQDRFRVARRRGRFGFLRTCAALIELVEEAQQLTRGRLGKILVEAKANGPPVIAALQEHVSGLCPREPEGSKGARANACAGDVESNHVYLLDGAIWLPEFVDECAAFPSASSNDDQVDEMTMALLEWKSTSAAARAAALCNLKMWSNELEHAAVA